MFLCFPLLLIFCLFFLVCFLRMNQCRNLNWYLPFSCGLILCPHFENIFCCISLILTLNSVSLKLFFLNLLPLLSNCFGFVSRSLLTLPSCLHSVALRGYAGMGVLSYFPWLCVCGMHFWQTTALSHFSTRFCANAPWRQQWHRLRRCPAGLVGFGLWFFSLNFFGFCICRYGDIIWVPSKGKRSGLRGLGLHMYLHSHLDVWVETCTAGLVSIWAFISALLSANLCYQLPAYHHHQNTCRRAKEEENRYKEGLCH